MVSYICLSFVFVLCGAQTLFPSPSNWVFSRTGSTSLAQHANKSWVAFDADTPRVTTRGLLIEPERTNLCENNNYSPSTLDGFASKPSLFSLEPDSDMLRAGGFGPLLDSGLMNGKVFMLMATGDGPNQVNISGPVGTLNPVIYSAWARSYYGGGEVSIGIGNAPLVSTDREGWTRLSGKWTPQSVDETMFFRVGAGDMGHFILNQLEVSSDAAPSSPILTKGASATRGMDVAKFTLPQDASSLVFISVFEGLSSPISATGSELIVDASSSNSSWYGNYVSQIQIANRTISSDSITGTTNSDSSDATLLISSIVLSSLLLLC